MCMCESPERFDILCYSRWAVGRRGLPEAPRVLFCVVYQSTGEDLLPLGHCVQHPRFVPPFSRNSAGCELEGLFLSGIAASGKQRWSSESLDIFANVPYDGRRSGQCVNARKPARNSHSAVTPICSPSLNSAASPTFRDLLDFLFPIFSEISTVAPLNASKFIISVR